METPPSESEEAGSVDGPPRAEMLDDEIRDTGRKRKRAALYSMPFLLLGLGNVVLILSWGLEPLWAFALLPPILFCTVLTYLVFSTDFLEGREGVQ